MEDYINNNDEDDNDGNEGNEGINWDNDDVENAQYENPHDMHEQDNLEDSMMMSPSHNRVTTSGGGYGDGGCDNEYSVAMSQTPSTTQTPLKKERRQVEKKIVHHIFQECMECTDDPYWQQFFDDCSRGKFPRGSSYDIANKTVCIRSIKIPEFYKIQPDADPEILFEDLRALFMEKLNLSSNEDQKTLNVEHDRLKAKSKAKYSANWADIGTKRIKNCIVRNFILTLAAKHSLTEDQTTQVYNLVKLGFMFGWIDNNHVLFEDRQITDITTLVFNPTTKTFKFNIKDVVVTAVKHKPKIVRMDSLWDKTKAFARNQYNI
jgi:hypothetical protein